MLLLTGATGLVGSALLRRLVAEGDAGALPGARPPAAGRPARARADRARRPHRPAVLPQRAARRAHGRAPRRLDPRPAARVDRGAQRHRHLADGRGGRALRGGALRVLLRARRLHPPPRTLLPRQGARRAGGARGAPALDRVRPLDRLRPRGPLAHAARASGPAPGDAGLRAGARRSISRSGPRTWPTA